MTEAMPHSVDQVVHGSVRAMCSWLTSAQTGCGRDDVIWSVYVARDRQTILGIVNERTREDATAEALRIYGTERLPTGQTRPRRLEIGHGETARYPGRALR